MIFDANNDLRYENNVFDVLGGNVNNFASLGCFSGFNTSLDPYYMYLEDLKIMWIIFFNPSYDFSMAIDDVKRIPILFSVVFIITSYLLFSTLWS